MFYPSAVWSDGQGQIIIVESSRHQGQSASANARLASSLFKRGSFPSAITHPVPTFRPESLTQCWLQMRPYVNGTPQIPARSNWLWLEGIQNIFNKCELNARQHWLYYEKRTSWFSFFMALLGHLGDWHSYLHSLSYGYLGANPAQEGSSASANTAQRQLGPQWCLGVAAVPVPYHWLHYSY